MTTLEAEISRLGIDQYYQYAIDYDPVKVYENFSTRHNFLLQYSFAMPDVNSIRKIVDFIDADVLSVGAGKGLWEHLITLELKNRQKEYVVRAIDHKKYDDVYYQVELLDINELEEKYPILFLSWPHCNNMDSLALSKNNPVKVIYIGEKYGGCTGSDEFHCKLQQDYKKVEKVRIKCWMGTHDRVVLYRKKFS